MLALFALVAASPSAQEPTWHAAHAPRYSIRRIAPLAGHGGSFAADIDDEGRVVGTSGTVAAFVWENGETRALVEASPGLPTRAEGIGPGGRVVGSATIPWTEVATLWSLAADDQRASVQLGFAPGDRQSVAYAINAHGLAVGYTDDSSFARPAAFRTDTQEITVLPMRPGDVSGVAFDISDQGVAVGQTAAFGPTQACRWQPTGDGWAYEELPSLTPGAPSEARAIDDLGRVAGHSIGVDGRWAFAVWDAGEVVRLGGAAPHDAFAQGIGASGEVVGYVVDTTTLERRAVLHPGSSAPSAPPIDLTWTLPAGSPWGVLREASAINSSGDVVGFGEVQGGTHAFLLTPIRRTLRIDRRDDDGALHLAVLDCEPGAWIELYAGHSGGETVVPGLAQSLDISGVDLVARAVARDDGRVEVTLRLPARALERGLWLQGLDRTAGEVTQVISITPRPALQARAGYL